MKNSTIQGLKARYAAGSIDRRQFIMSALAAGAVLPAAMSIADDVLAATPNKGGTLRQAFGHGSTTDSLDPSTFENGWMQNVAYTYANHLTEVNGAGELVPELAESFESTPDGKTWVFRLRKGIEFHNGKSLTADDIIASFKYHLREDSKSTAKALLEQVEVIKKDGDHSVVFELKTGNADFPYIMSDYHFIMLPEKDGSIDWASGKGTGPYILKDYEPGVRATFERNPNYWKDNAAFFDAVETLSILDATARQTAASSGSVDLIDKVDPKTVALLARVPSLKILEVTGTQHYSFPMRCDVPPFDNLDFRLAIKYLTNRQELLDKILVGHGAVGNDHPISSSQTFFAKDLAVREQDFDKAKHHLKKSGFTGSIELSASDAAFPGAVDAATLISNSAKKIGLNIEVVREPNDGYWTNVWNKKPFCACYWGGRATADWMFSAAYSKDAKWNDAVWYHDRFNDLLTQARAELDNSKRQALYADMQKIVSDEGGTLIPMYANHIHAMSKKLMHPEKIAGNWQNDGNKNTERWWFG